MIEYDKEVTAEDLHRMEAVQSKLWNSTDQLNQCVYWIAVAVWHILHYIRRMNS